MRMFEAAGAGEIATESVPESALQAQMETASDPLQQSFAGLMLQCASGDTIDGTTSQRVFPFRIRWFAISSPSAGPGVKTSCPPSLHSSWFTAPSRARPRGISSRLG